MRKTERSHILLVGASGKLGQHVQAVWRNMARDNWNFTCQYRKETYGKNLIWDPLKELEPLKDWVVKHGPFDSLVMLAGITNLSAQTLVLNSQLAESCLFAAEQIGIRRVLLASSSAVYGVKPKGSFSEGDPLNPINSYGKSKLDMESNCKSRESKTLEICSMRIGNIVGADSVFSRAASMSLKKILEIDQFSDGKGPLRSYMGPRRFAETVLNLCLADVKLPRTLNIASDPPIYMEEIATKSGLNWRWREASSAANQNITLDLSQLNSICRKPNLMVDARSIVEDLESVRELM